MNSLPNESKSVIYINGEFVPEVDACLSPLDRGFLYGDALFESIRVAEGRPFLWDKHLARLAGGARFLDLLDPFPDEKVEKAARTLITANKIRDGFVRIYLSRGVGERGYSPRGAHCPTLLMTTHPATSFMPDRMKVISTQVRVLGDDPLSRFKTNNRLANIRARREADDQNADEALLLNHRGMVACATAANIFLITKDGLATPPVTAGALRGTTREFVVEMANKMKIEVSETEFGVEAVRAADGVFLTSAGLLVTPVEAIDGQALSIDHALLKELRNLCKQACDRS